MFLSHWYIDNDSIIIIEFFIDIRMNFSQQYIEYGYKEILLLPGKSGEALLSKSHLHIWPHHEFMMIALPNEVNLIHRQYF